VDVIRARGFHVTTTPACAARREEPGEAKDVFVEDAEQLMARVRARDAAAFEMLYDAYHRLVYGIAMRMLGEASAAEDVTQAVFLKLWTSPQLFVSGNFAGWLVRVTRNRTLDILRTKSHAHAELPLQQPTDDLPEDHAFAAIDAQRVRAALKQLPSEQREPIELGFFGGITHDEIARRTGVALGTVKTRIRTGLRRLRSTLEGTVTSV
jgi:RNA polymerase sigma-70 factor (ECF subfamily)